MAVKEPIHILLADDDKDDHLFFMEALSELVIASEVTIIENGEEFVSYMTDIQKPPDIVFLDYNMPRKNGLECLKELLVIKVSENVPIIIYSTFINTTLADELYENGACHYIQKCNFPDLVKMLFIILSRLQKDNLTRTSKESFLITPEKLLDDNQRN